MPKLSPARKEVGGDLAVVEEWGQYDECAAHTDAFGNDVTVIECSESGMRKACQGWGGDKISIICRDPNRVPPGSAGYLHKTCGAS